MSIENLSLYLLNFFLIFSSGTFAGWIIEVFWRRFFGKAKRWINPGFLNGPWLPLYGFGCIFLYLLCLPQWPLYIKIPVFMISLTILELIAGIIFLEHYKIRLWDYSHNKANYKGLICPLYSVFWTFLGLFFNYCIYPHLENMISVLNQHLQLSFFIGLYGGLFSADVWLSFNIAGRIRKFVKETEEKLPVDFERLKLELRHKKSHFFLPFHGELGVTFKDKLKTHMTLFPKSKILNHLNPDHNKNEG
ncbi:MAG: putative ABC transporter permease [Spirochaetales bacterium]|nr:putative ABC transporter permease [Spirochaetales bacterium]